jgi:S-(hydroxymethyl)glutathione dehydrogenase/alcohol dehydrogenase
MKAAVVYDPGSEVTVSDVELTEIGEQDVRVRIVSSGLCHSDVAVQNGNFPYPVPCVIGHEGAGIVEEVGSRVNSVRTGDHVLLSATISCGQCEQCTKGLPCTCQTGFASILAGVNPDGRHRMRDSADRNLTQFACLGTLADQVIVSEASVIKIRDDVPLEIASLVGCAVVTGLGAVFNRAKVAPGSSVAIIGCGGIGLSSVQGARIAGASQIIAVEPVKEKRELALELGATDAIDPAEEAPVERVKELTGGLGANYAFEAVGIPDLFRQAWDMVRIDGTAIGIGVAPIGTEIKLPAIELSTSEKTLMSTTYGTSRPRQDMPLYLEMYMNGQLRLDPLISRHYELGQINEAIADLEAGRIHGRGVFAISA